MKTWKQALDSHRARLGWCGRFTEILVALDQAGAPPPDDVNAAHADWGTPDGIIRVGMTLETACHITISGNRALREKVLANTPPEIKRGEELGDVVTLWADLLRRQANPDFSGRVSTDGPARPLDSMFPLDDDETAKRLGQQMAGERDKPYHRHDVISTKKLAEDISNNIMSDGVLFDMTGDRVEERRWSVIELHVRQVLDQYRKDGRL